MYSLCRHADLAQVAHVFCRFRALKSAIEDWNERLRRGCMIVAITTSNSIRVKARSTGGGELLAMTLSLGAHDIALGPGAKGKKS